MVVIAPDPSPEIKLTQTQRLCLRALSKPDGRLAEMAGGWRIRYEGETGIMHWFPARAVASLVHDGLIKNGRLTQAGRNATNRLK